MSFVNDTIVKKYLFINKKFMQIQKKKFVKLQRRKAYIETLNNQRILIKSLRKREGLDPEVIVFISIVKKIVSNYEVILVT